MWIQIPYVPPSLNIWKNWHWSKQRKYKKELTDSIIKLVIAFRLPRYHKAVVSIVYYHSTERKRDPVDNYAPKFILDSLVNSGILFDDNGDVVKVQPVQMRIDKTSPRTEIFIKKLI